MPCFSKKLEVHYYVHNSLPLDPILSQLNQVQTFKPYFIKLILKLSKHPHPCLEVVSSINAFISLCNIPHPTLTHLSDHTNVIYFDIPHYVITFSVLHLLPVMPPSISDDNKELYNNFSIWTIHTCRKTKLGQYLEIIFHVLSNNNVCDNVPVHITPLI
jgi:hypothetical protein